MVRLGSRVLVLSQWRDVHPRRGWGVVVGWGPFLTSPRKPIGSISS